MMRLTWAAQVKCMGEVCPLPVESTLMRRLNLWFYPGFGCCKSRVITFHIWQAVDAVPLQAAMEGGSSQMRQGRLQGIQAIVERS